MTVVRQYYLGVERTKALKPKRSEPELDPRSAVYQFPNGWVNDLISPSLGDHSYKIRVIC